ncbi:MAG: hypothetical protein LBS49_03140 [Candidatus Accumulibacter sp.]|jgi:hypothetical protein|nr:hypothetical protein [Accumulibacter sp.]
MGYIHSLLCLRPMQALGRVSYSWYLWHWPVLLLGASVYMEVSLTGRLALALLSLLLAWISYRYAELPIRHNDYLLRRPVLTVTGTLATLAAASAFCLVYWGGRIETNLAAPEYSKLMAIRYDLPGIYSMGCDDWFHSAEVKICQFGDENASRTAVLMGDSIAGQWFPTVARHFVRPGWKLLVITKSSCPMVDKPFFYPRIGREYVECASWRESALSLLASMRPEHVVMSSAENGIFSPEEWEEGTRKVLQTLSPHVGRITLIRGTLALPFDGIECLASNGKLAQFLTDGKRCQASSANARSDEVFAALRKAASAFDNARVLDMNDAICPQGQCRAELNGQIVFRDSQHLTARFAEYLGTEFAQRLDADK